MRKRITGFPSDDIAFAFIDGAEYVNDSALHDFIVEPLVPGAPISVVFEDDDYDAEDYADTLGPDLTLNILYRPGEMGA